MIKKLAESMLVLLMVVMTVSGCSVQTEQSQSEQTYNQEQENEKEKEEYIPPTEYQFDANVSEIHTDYLMVEALEGQNVAGTVQIWIGALAEGALSGVVVGDTVRITHDGKMTMSIPPQMSAVELVLLSGCRDI